MCAPLGDSPSIADCGLDRFEKGDTSAFECNCSIAGRPGLRITGQRGRVLRVISCHAPTVRTGTYRPELSAGCVAETPLCDRAIQNTYEQKSQQTGRFLRILFRQMKMRTVWNHLKALPFVAEFRSTGGGVTVNPAADFFDIYISVN
jgi:hypothetical protein